MKNALFALMTVVLLVLVGLIAGAAGGEEASRLVPGDLDVELTTTVQLYPGQDYFIYFDQDDMQLHAQEVQPLPPNVQEAINKAPEWMRFNLTYKFRRLPGDARNTYANLILTSPDDRYIDEIAWCVAHMAVSTLTDDNFFPQLLTHNAQMIYEVDPYLRYVDILEKGEYTTVVYKDKQNNSVELDRDIYYWGIVHPKLSDELPTYVDPEYDFTSQPPFDRDAGTPPPTGKFWREWLFYHQDDPVNLSGTWKYNPLLKDKLSEPWTLWDAIKACNSWVSGSMKFTSDLERPNQPVRIYRKHMGRCGEHQDMRNAIARIGLIPCVSTSNAAEDHVWNEFWDGRWIHWDGAMDNPRMYENGWGKTISAVWNQRGDNHIWGVTPKYSDTCNYTAKVLDDAGLPVDGALVRVQTENFYNPDTLTTTIWGTTGLDGVARFQIGDYRNYWSSADSNSLGEDPQFGNNQIITDAQTNANYSYTFHLPDSAARLEPDELDNVDDDPRFLMEVDYTVDRHIMRGRAVYGSDRPSVFGAGGNIDFFITNELNYYLYDNDVQFSAYNFSERGEEGSVSLALPDDNTYYAVLSNDFSQETMKEVTITVRVTSELKVKITEPAGGSVFELEDMVPFSGTSFSPWGVESVEYDIDGSDNWTMATDNAGLGESPWETWGFRWDTLLEDPGEHTVAVRASDSKHSKTTQLTILLVDAIKPIVEFDQPEDDGTAVSLGESISLAGTATDNVGVVSVFLYVDDDKNASVDLEANRQGDAWAYELSTSELAIGGHTVTVNATDAAGNFGEAAITFEVMEIISPTVLIDRPLEGAAFRAGDSVEVSGRASDNNEIASLSMTIAGDKTDLLPYLLGDGTFTMLLDTSGIPEGIQNILVSASDASGNEGEARTSMILDDTEPTVSIGEPVKDGIYEGSVELVVSGNAGDNVGVAEIRLVVDGQDSYDITKSLSQGKWEFRELETSGWTSGKHSLKVLVKDLVGLQSDASVTFTIDNQGPAVDITRIDEPVIIGTTIRLHGGAYDNIKIDTLELMIGDGSPMDITHRLAGSSWDYHWNSTGTPEGVYIVTVRITDVVGLQAEAQATLEVARRDETVIEDDDVVVDDDSEDDDEESSSFADNLSGALILVLVLGIAILMIAALGVIFYRSRQLPSEPLEEQEAFTELDTGAEADEAGPGSSEDAERPRGKGSSKKKPAAGKKKKKKTSKND